MGGCETTEIMSDVPCPNRPALINLEMDEILRMEEETMIKVASNQIMLKEYAQKLEVRAGCDNP